MYVATYITNKQYMRNLFDFGKINVISNKNQWLHNYVYIYVHYIASYLY